MNTYAIALSALLTLTAVDARASEADTARFAPTSAASSLTRADVQREARRALAAHEIAFGDVQPVTVSGSVGRSRQDVRDETLMALMQKTRPGERGLYAN